ncbi:MAG: DUF2254 domain-containing protein [Pyrinomonadaceae bacterium]|nr:DUF2254 domain-containing protein [Pyrinomonadaceae bacterium]
MSWLRRYHLRSFFNNSAWLLPVISIFVALVTVSLLNRLERAMGWEAKVSRDTAMAVMGTIAASTFTLVVVVSSATLVAVQLASAQLTPRIISLVYRDTVRKLTLAVFVFTFTFSVAVLVRIQGTVPLVTSYLAAYGFIINLGLFLYSLDFLGKSLRPSSALRNVARIGREVIRSVYPRLLDEHSAAPEPIKGLEGQPDRIVLNSEDGAVLAFDINGLVSLAERSNCLIELMPEVGDFIATGDPLFRVFNGGKDLSEETLRNSVAIGSERTMEQDPMFVFRILVDIASKALSPAINDPTTAVLATDQLHHLLRDVGRRYLADGHEKDRAGEVRLVYRTPDWEDFVQLSITELRHYGHDSIQVMRRLRSMLENLIATLPDHRAPTLHRELRLLTNSSRRSFPDSDDQELAEGSDRQGMGGSERDRKLPITK